MRAAAYARFSTERQTENSIDTQLATISRYCRDNGHSVVSTYVDMAMSGTNTDRPDFQRMIEGARAKQFECIVIYDISRGSRDVSDWFAFRKQMQRLNIQVLSATDKLGDISNPNDFLVELLSVGLGQHMVLQTRQKSMAGVANKAKQGLFLGGYPPLGYDVVDAHYVINEREAQAVRLIFDLYAHGSSYNNIIDELQKTGLKGKRGASIGKNSLNSILQNERYIGIYTWNKHQIKNMGKWAGGILNPNVIRLENAIPVIIDMDTWERVQKRMKENKSNAKNSAIHEYLLSGLIVCGECGATYTGRTSTSGKGYTTRCYACGNKYRNRTCKAPNINADELEVAVAMYLKDYLQNGDFESMADEILKTYKSGVTDRTAEKKELAKIEKEIANATKAIMSGLDYPELREETARLQVRKAELQDILALSPDVVLTKEMIIEQLKKDAASLNDGDMQRLIKTYITKIYAHNDEVIITGGVNLIGCGGRI